MPCLNLFQKMFHMLIMVILWPMIKKKLKESLNRRMIENMKEILFMFLTKMIRP